MKNQEIIALGIVVLATMSLVIRFFKTYLSDPTAKWLLKKGHVKLAMSLRKQVGDKAGCSNCSCT